MLCSFLPILVALLSFATMPQDSGTPDSPTDDPDQLLEKIDQNWDGAQWINFRRWERLVRDDGSFSGGLRHVWDGSAWQPTSGNRRTNVADGGMDWVLVEKWDGADWVIDFREREVLDSDGRQTESIFQRLADDNWANSSRLLFVYDARGNRLERRSQIWNGSEWQDTALITTEYDDQDRITLSEQVDLSGDSPQNQRRTDITYSIGDQGEGIVVRVNQAGEDDGWVNEIRNVASFDADGRPLEEAEEKWINGEWLKDQRNVRTYDEAGNLVESMYYSASPNSTEWEPTDLQTWTFDDQNRITGSHQSLWDDGAWEDFERATYRYSDDGLRMDIDRERYRDSAWEWKSTQWSIQDGRGNETETGNGTWDGAQFVNGSRSLMSYSIETKVSGDVIPTDFEVGTLQNYPNPFRGSTSISYELRAAGKAHLSIVDILGRTVAVLVDEDQVAGRHTVQWRPITSAGVYIARLETEGGVATRKLMMIGDGRMGGM